MINTTLAVLALAAGLDLSVPTAPKWQPDYSKALSRASEERKPMAVFIGHGADAAKRMLADGAIPAEAAKMLSASYVCLYLDTDTASGKDMAKQFDMTQGLVISSPGGNVQAYRYAGAVPASTLTKELTHYAAAGQPTTTVSAGDVVPSGYIRVGGSCPNGTCGTLVPASGYTVPGSSCPNGRCPYQR